MLASSLLIRQLINTMELPFLVDKVNLTINKETYAVAWSTQQHSIIPGYEFVTALVWALSFPLPPNPLRDRHLPQW